MFLISFVVARYLVVFCNVLSVADVTYVTQACPKGALMVKFKNVASFKDFAHCTLSINATKSGAANLPMIQVNSSIVGFWIQIPIVKIK